MRYKTFRALVIIGLIGAAAGGFHIYQLRQERAGLEREIRSFHEQRQEEERKTAAPSAQPPAPEARPLPAGAVPLRPMDLEILAAAAANISGDKVKDAIRGRPWKVNLFRDAGQQKVNRLKIDLDRDDKWDEKWSWDPEGLQRQIAPADDEQYTVQTWYDTNLNAWTSAKPSAGMAPVVAETAPGIPSSQAGLPDGAIALRPMDTEILAAAAANIPGDKVKDAIRGRSWKVNLFRDAGQPKVNRLKIDLDRDDKWDEKWSWKEGRVTREVASNDDEIYDRRFHLDSAANAWLPD
ncbi:MAG TPA: hypothetical protein VIV61_18180 [Candidatus Ozemobacteraceae bacterium]